MSTRVVLIGSDFAAPRCVDSIVSMLRWARAMAAFGSTEEILSTLTSNSITARELRQNNPFAGLLDEATRLQVISATGHKKS